MTDFRIKRWSVSVDGYPSHPYYASSRAKACRDAYWSYRCAHDCRFRDFLKMALCRLDPSWDGQFGKPITVGGKPAFFVTHNNQYVQFSRPGGDEYFNAHPFDVEPEEFRP